jgi:hypothetical protein|tara:strand:- start:1733 stop:2965 length:1233 start_codon:yes stop_codon:yes gene_type:complete
MSYSIFAGKQKSLVFPVMCNGFLTIDYAKNVPDATTSADTSDDIPYGIWAHQGSFTFEAMVTPYDINGSGAYTANQSHISILDSKKIFPDLGHGGQIAEGDRYYMEKSTRLTHRMAIFYSPTFQVFLQNVSKHNYRNPAEYKIVVKLKLGNNSIETFTSPIAIQATTDSYVKYSSSDSFNGLDANGRTAFIKLGDSTAGSFTYTSGNINGTFVVHNSAFPVNSPNFGAQDVFVKDGDSYIQIGTLKSLATTFLSVHVGSGPITDYTSLLNSGAEIFIEAEKDGAYVNNMFHIACSYDDTDKRINIFLDGSLIFTGTSSNTETFEFLRENMYIGANATGTHGGAFDANLENRGSIGNHLSLESAVDNEQFMGELHEMSFLNIVRNEFSSITNLTPNYANTLFYLRFEEVDV